MTNLKIALCKSSLLGPVSGADEIMLNYAVHLHQRGYDVEVVLLYSPNENDQYLRRLRGNGVPVTIIVRKSFLFAVLRMLRNVFSSVLFFLFLLRRAPERLRKFWQVALRLIAHLHYRECRAYFARNRPNLMHVFTPDSGAAMMIRAGHELGIPVLYHEMGTPHHMPMLEDYYRRLENVLPLCTEFAALSPRLASDWLVRFPFLRSVTVLPLIMERSKTFDLRGQLSAPPEETVFGFAARVEEGKGPMVLLDALATMNRERPVAIVRIAGSGPQLSEVKARARELALGDACEFVGQYSEPLGRSAFMESLDVFVLPSLAEGTPNGVIEAMAHGVPIIASAVGGIPDIIDSQSGILIPPGDADALADAMLLLSRDPERRKQMGAAARERYEKLFEPAVVVPLMLRVYGRLAGNGHMAIASGNGHSHPWADVQLQTAIESVPL
jgi:glycosyltransferase involved in cell wall biosynthesis